MKKLLITGVALCFMGLAVPSFATPGQDQTQQDQMKKDDGMKKTDAMKKDDGMKHDDMSKDSTAKKKDEERQHEERRCHEKRRRNEARRHVEGRAQELDPARWFGPGRLRESHTSLSRPGFRHFPLTLTARDFLSFKIRRTISGTPQRIGHATGARGVTLANRLFWGHHMILSVHEGAARHMKHFAAVNNCHKTLRQSPGRLTHFGAGLRHEAIKCRRAQG